jgi:hypothetical protein
MDRENTKHDNGMRRTSYFGDLQILAAALETFGLDY